MRLKYSLVPSRWELFTCVSCRWTNKWQRLAWVFIGIAGCQRFVKDGKSIARREKTDLRIIFKWLVRAHSFIPSTYDVRAATALVRCRFIKENYTEPNLATAVSDAPGGKTTILYLKAPHNHGLFTVTLIYSVYNHVQMLRIGYTCLVSCVTILRPFYGFYSNLDGFINHGAPPSNLDSCPVKCIRHMSNVYVCEMVFWLLNYQALWLTIWVHRQCLRVVLPLQSTVS